MKKFLIALLLLTLTGCSQGLEKPVQQTAAIEQVQQAVIGDVIAEAGIVSIADGELEPSAAPEGELEPSTPPEGELEPSAAPEGGLAPSATPEGELAPSATPEGELAPSATPEGELAPSAAPGIKPTPQESSASLIPEPTMEPEGEQVSTTPIDVNALPNELFSWYYNKNSDHKPPTAQNKFDITQFDAYYLGDTNGKTVYLTFDEGYENGYTAQILDVLKEKNVKAAFFVTKTYIKANVELIKRMVEEGHIVGNHSVTHPSLPEISNNEVEYEIMETERFFNEMTGYTMDKFFRPPKGEYSQRTLGITKELGYKSIFWSFAYQDWLVDNQPPLSETFKRVMDGLHNGEIMLLHAVSKSNTEALPDIIDAIRAEGYRFAELNEIN